MSKQSPERQIKLKVADSHFAAHKKTLSNVDSYTDLTLSLQCMTCLIPLFGFSYKRILNSIERISLVYADKRLIGFNMIC